jgi:pimeloyl-ACP methyl ester carboxylesterase
MTSMKRLLVGALVVAVGCAGPTASPSVVASPSLDSSPSSTAFRGDVDIGGDRHLYLECEGSGQPTVILDAGLATDHSTWSSVMPDVAKVTRACAYDRSGVGRSSPVEDTKTTEDAVDDLQAMIDAAHLQPPFVLVGHSIAGFSLRLFAGRHADELAGEIYVDPSQPGQPEKVLAAMPPEEADDPPTVTALRRGLQAGWPKPDETSEHYDIDTSEAAVEAVRSLGSLPVVVLTAFKVDPRIPDRVNQRTLATWIEIQRDLAAMSTEGRQEIVQDASHNIQLDRPDRVAAAIRELIDRWRTR